jgi:FkbM family methyltransferase
MLTRLAAHLYDSPLRAFTRALGINHLLTRAARRRQRNRLDAYDRDRPQSVRLSIAGLSAELRVADATEYMRVCSAEEDRELIDALATALEPGQTYWDIGASIGIYSLLIAVRVGPTGRVVAFEPERRSFQRLSENIALNGLRHIAVQPIALGDAAREMTMTVVGPASSGAHRLDDAASGPDATIVSVLPGDTFRRDYGEGVPQVLKIDVEGAEESVIRGLSQTLREQACRAVLCEVHFSIHASRGDTDAPRRIRAMLAAAGFQRQRWLDPSHLFATK